jgi:glycosyltransferase involved in cell wall biosynthesis
MASFDVALMPFALNDATRAISPTKTLEYFAAGLPIVSTRVPDVLSDFGDFVHFADDAQGFADACVCAGQQDLAGFRARVAPVIRQRDWDTVAQNMANHIDHAVLARINDARAADA